MTYSIEIKKSVLKMLRRVSRDDQIKISKVIKKLAKDPRGQNCLKLADSPYYRIRCGHYRIIYDIQDNRLVIVILKVGHRKDVYQNR